MGKPHFVAEPVILSSEAAFWQELEGEWSVLGVPCVCICPCFCTSVSLLMMVHSASCGSCGVCVLSLQAVSGCPVPPVGLGGAPVGGSRAELLRLMRQQL